jgi:nitrite reductase/ring-hydroxylating ferredoxin subunit
VSDPPEDLLEEVQQLMAALEAHPEPAVRDQVRRLLAGIDMVHRTALTRLVNAVHAMAGEAFINRLTADPAIRLLLTSYDLLAVDRRLLAEEALDAVRGHLHGRGIDVELRDVIGGEVFVRLHGLEAAEVPLERVRHDLEAALTAGLPGFQALVVGDRDNRTRSPLLQIGLGRLQRPVFRPVLAVSELPIGHMKGVDVDGTPILLVNVGGELLAVSNRCGESPLPLEFGALEGAELRCSWHGCRYDVRTGERLDGGAERLTVFPVAQEREQIQVAVGVESAVKD